MIVKRFIALLLLLLPFCYGDENVAFDMVADRFPQLQTVAQKLETASVAYYGTLLDRNIYDEKTLSGNKNLFTQKYPQVYKSFVGWVDVRQKRQNELLDQAPEKYRRMFENRYSALFMKGAYLIHHLILVEKIYDKATKTWISPKPEETRKSLFSFAYIGPDISKDSSSWKFSQRMMNIALQDDDGFVHRPKKARVFFLDGFSQECNPLMDPSNLGNLRYYPLRLKYDVPENPAVEIREKMQAFVENGNYAAADSLADAADLAPRSKIILKILNHDYDFVLNNDSTMYYLDGRNDYFYTDKLDSVLDMTVKRVYDDGAYCKTVKNVSDVCNVVKKVALQERPDYYYNNEGRLRFNWSFVFGHPFMVGKFPDFDPALFLEFDFNVYWKRWVYGIGLNARAYDAKCDSCGANDMSFYWTFGYTWLKTTYVESVAFGNVGFATFSKKENSKNLTEDYFRYGLGSYFDLIFPNLIGKNVQPADISASRFSLRLMVGLNNMNVSKISRAQGISSYISLGLTWHYIWGMEIVRQSEYRRKEMFGNPRPVYVD